VTTLSCRINAAIHKADDAFWGVIVAEFPEAVSGDLSIESVDAINSAMRMAVEEWVEYNVPGGA
jgi:predicted RNase H-like HicB family nuclease